MSPGAAPKAASVITMGKDEFDCTGGDTGTGTPAIRPAMMLLVLTVHEAVTAPAAVAGCQYGYRAMPLPLDAPALTEVRAVKPVGPVLSVASPDPDSGTARQPSEMPAAVAVESSVRLVVASGAVESPAE